MKKIVSIIAAISLCMVSMNVFAGCEEKPFVDTSNAVSLNTFDDPKNAKAQEAKDDEIGREHIEIPDGAETIEIDGEQYIPIDNIDEIRSVDYDKNFILKHDIDISGGKGWIGTAEILAFGNYSTTPFTGKFNGNNYKLYGERNRSLFGYIKDAEISNIIFSSEIDNSQPVNIQGGSMILCGIAENSVIKNIVNYSLLGRKNQSSSTGMVLYLYKSTIENVINYGDVAEGSSAIVKYMFDSTVRNCKNYGNISYKRISPTGAIVSEILANHMPVLTSNHEVTATAGSVVENCENYGNIIGTNYMGGIVGRVAMFNDAYTIGVISDNYFTDLSKIKLFSNPSVVKNCTNYGNIYRDKDYEEDPLNLTVLCCIGGIIGLGNSVENCTNNGNIYGFETVNPGYTVDYIGGVTGAACSIVDCDSTTQLVATDTIEHTDDVCGYFM